MAIKENDYFVSITLSIKDIKILSNKISEYSKNELKISSIEFFYIINTLYILYKKHFNIPNIEIDNFNRFLYKNINEGDIYFK